MQQLPLRQNLIGRATPRHPASLMASPKRPYSPGIYLYRKNSLSMKQKPITLANYCYEEEISRLDVVHDSPVQQTKPLLQIMTNQSKTTRNSPSHLHRLKAKQPLQTRQFMSTDKTCSIIIEGKLRTEPSKTERSVIKRALQIEDTVEYSCWLNRFRSHNSNMFKQNIPVNNPTTKQVNISVKLVNRRFLYSKPDPISKKSTHITTARPHKKRSMAV